MPRALQQHFIARSRSSTIAPVALSCLALLLAAGAGGSFHHWLVRDDEAREFDDFRHVGIATIRAQLDQVEGPYIVITGATHAERLYLSRLCDLPVVNAGISGATISDVLDLSRAITPRHKASALLLSVGANDIWAKRGPETDHAEGVFQAGLVALKSRLTMWSDHRAIVAITPAASNEKGTSRARPQSAIPACSPDSVSRVAASISTFLQKRSDLSTPAPPSAMACTCATMPVSYEIGSANFASTFA